MKIPPLALLLLQHDLIISVPPFSVKGLALVHSPFLLLLLHPLLVLPRISHFSIIIVLSSTNH